MSFTGDAVESHSGEWSRRTGPRPRCISTSPRWSGIKRPCTESKPKRWALVSKLDEIAAFFATVDNLIVMAWASGKISTKEVLRNWLIVYCGNLVGAVGLAILILLSHHLDMNGGRIGLSILNTAVAKISPDFVTLFINGVLCNLLVCMGVWIAYAGRSVTDKIVGLILPISAFVAAGFEHCVANMYFLPWPGCRPSSAEYLTVLMPQSLRYPGSSTTSCR